MISRPIPSQSRKGLFSFDAAIALLLATALLFAGLSLISNLNSRATASFSQEQKEIQLLEASDFLLRSGFVKTDTTGIFTKVNKPGVIDDSLFTDETIADLKTRLQLRELRACILAPSGLQIRCVPSTSQAPYCMRRIATYHDEVILLETCLQ